MPRYDLVTVVYEEEIDLLALQARSIDLFGRRLSIDRICIIANGPDQDRTIQRLRSEVLPRYGDRASQVQIVPARDLMELSESAPGWRSQQVLKLAIASHIESELYITLDAKNHLVQESSDGIFFNPAGVPFYHPSSLRNMSTHFLNCAEICGLDWRRHIDWGYPTITPAVLYTSHVRDLHRFIEKSGHETFEAMMCSKRMDITEYMLYYCYLRKMNVFDDLYAPGPRMVITLWTLHVDDDKVFQRLMHEAETNTVPFFSLHRLARRRLTQRQAARIARFWCTIGLARSAQEANVYLAVTPRDRLVGTVKRHLKRMLPAAVVARLQGVPAPLNAPGVDSQGSTPGSSGSANISVKVVEASGTDNLELRERVVSLARLLRPMKAAGYAKKRFGSKHAGGYVMLDDFSGISAAFSLGLAGNADWDREIADKAIPVHRFDGSMDGAPFAHPRCTLHPAAIGPGKDRISFDALASDYAGGPLDTASAIMKMDIEHWEWSTLGTARASSLRKFRQLVVEFHCLDLVAVPYWWLQAQAVLTKLQEEFCVVHVHANVMGGALVVGGVPFPNVLEVTFASRHYYTFEETDELFPTPLDASCDPRLPDLYLGSFKF